MLKLKNYRSVVAYLASPTIGAVTHLIFFCQNHFYDKLGADLTGMLSINGKF